MSVQHIAFNISTFQSNILRSIILHVNATFCILKFFMSMQFFEVSEVHISMQVYTSSLGHFNQLWHFALQTPSHYIALHCIGLHCIALHFTALHCAILHCTTGLASTGLGRCRRFVGGDFKDGRPVAGSNGAYCTQSWYLSHPVDIDFLMDIMSSKLFFFQHSLIGTWRETQCWQPSLTFRSNGTKRGRCCHPSSA